MKIELNLSINGQNLVNKTASGDVRWWISQFP
jgi:hypothetical protein